jgi:hypothetical protein
MARQPGPMYPALRDTWFTEVQRQAARETTQAAKKSGSNEPDLFASLLLFNEPDPFAFDYHGKAPAGARAFCTHPMSGVSCTVRPTNLGIIADDG